uniref:Uncharacterized protein n=1 Tax=Glossina palpalis gambiensis TaxID=67801 RepID=A0A1B0BAL1_9MUSC
MALESKDLDMVMDIIIPCILLVGLFIINGVILVLICRKRKNLIYENFEEIAPKGDREQEGGSESMEMGRL